MKNFRETDEEERLYKKIGGQIKSSFYTKEEKYAARCYYLTCWYERHAFVHGLYGFLSTIPFSERTIENIYDKFRQSDQYNDLNLMKTIIDNYDFYRRYFKAFLKTDRKVTLFKDRLIYNFKKFSKACGKILLDIRDNERYFLGFEFDKSIFQGKQFFYHR